MQGVVWIPAHVYIIQVSSPNEADVYVALVRNRQSDAHAAAMEERVSDPA